MFRRQQGGLHQDHSGVAQMAHNLRFLAQELFLPLLFIPFVLLFEWLSLFFVYSRMRSEGSRFTWGSGGEAVFAKFCVCGRNRSQVSASVRNRLRWRRKALHSGERVCRGPETVSSWVVPPQLYWCLQRRCLCEWSVSPQLYWCLQRRCMREWSVLPQLNWCLQRRCLREWSVAPQLYRCLQRRCLWEWSVSSQLYWCLQRRCLCEWSVSPQLYWCLQRRCLQECHERIVLQECQIRSVK